MIIDLTIDESNSISETEIESNSETEIETDSETLNYEQITCSKIVFSHKIISEDSVDTLVFRCDLTPSDEYLECLNYLNELNNHQNDQLTLEQKIYIENVFYSHCNTVYIDFYNTRCRGLYFQQCRENNLLVDYNKLLYYWFQNDISNEESINIARIDFYVLDKLHSTKYYKNGKINNIKDMPSIIYYYLSGNIRVNMWFSAGKLHRGYKKPSVVVYHDISDYQKNTLPRKSNYISKYWYTRGKYIKCKHARMDNYH